MTSPSEPDFDALFETAKAARGRAYAPYSKYNVGAAILTDDGQVFAGCNVENAAYPVGTCAEAGAIAAMIMGGAKRIAAIAVIGATADICTPCGGCRQRIREFAPPNAQIAMLGDDGRTRLFTTLEELLPHSFGPGHLPTG